MSNSVSLRMYKQWQFWLVTLLTGFFAGALMLLVQLVLFHLTFESFSPIYILIYIIPFIAMAFACIRLRERYGQGVLGFGQAFRQALLTGLIAAIVMSVLVYFVYDSLFASALQLRAAQLNATLVKLHPELDFGLMKQRRNLVSQLMEPIALGIFYFLMQLLLLPIYAFIIAIFVRRRRRDITDM